MSTQLFDRIRDKAEELDWCCRVYDDGIEFEKWSPAGEDFVFYVEIEDPVREVRAYANDFDADEHAEMWIEGRGKNGVPNSVRTLIDDADAIQKMLDELADALEEVEQ